MAGGGGDTWAVVVARELGQWQVGLLPDRLSDDLPGLMAVVRQQPPDAAGMVLVNVADEFFVALRAAGSGVRLLLSDVTASVAWDLARAVCDELGMTVPDDDELEDVWPAGDLSLFADLGMDEMSLGALLSDLDAYADEQILGVAQTLGFADELDRALDAVLH